MNKEVKEVIAPVMEPIDPEGRGIRTLIYGDTGAGKTSFAASAALHPSFYPIISMNFDDGYTSITHLNGVNKSLGLPPIYATKVENPNQAMWIMREMLKPSDDRQGPYKGAKTLLIDSVSAWRDRTLEYVTTINTAYDAAKGKKRGEMSVPQIQDYGGMINILTSILYGLAQSGVNLILTAGVDEKVDDSGNVLSAAPLLNPKLQKTVGYMMDNIWYVQEKNNKYRLSTLPRGIQKIKTRNPLFVDALNINSLQSKENGGTGWFNMTIDENGYVTPNMGYFYDMYIQSIKEISE